MTLQKYTGSFTLAADSTLYTESLNVIQRPYSLFALTWTGLISFNARAILQMSSDGTNWNDVGGDTEGIILDVEEDTQVWLIEPNLFPYIRLELSTNNVNSGTITWEYRGLA